MSHYLSYQFEDSAEFSRYFDELPLWSAPFGLMLLDELNLFPGIQVADMGCGTGFPLFELAGRIGNSGHIYGIDPWEQAMTRCEEKCRHYGYQNITLIRKDAQDSGLKDATMDLVVSNLGINNFSGADQVFKEAWRILKPGGKIALTTNINGHWDTFYSIFIDTIKEFGNEEWIQAVSLDASHRGNVQSLTNVLISAGFSQIRIAQQELTMHFVNGTAFLNHHFIQPGWLSTWQALIPNYAHEEVFSRLEQRLNEFANLHQGLKLRVPMVYAEGVK